jgi:hypothetical protein
MRGSFASLEDDGEKQATAGEKQATAGENKQRQQRTIFFEDHLSM